MDLQLNIPFHQLLEMIKSLPKAQQQLLRVELEKSAAVKGKTTLEDLLMAGPVAGDDDLARIRSNRKMLNQWRSK
jgi:hypothetical protein